MRSKKYTISIENNRHSVSRQIAEDNDISQRPVFRILKIEKFHQYKVQLHEKLSEDDLIDVSISIQFMQDLCNRNSPFLEQSMLLDEATYVLRKSFSELLG